MTKSDPCHNEPDPYREHMKRMLAHGLDWINDNASGTNERAFDGEDAEEWQRRSEQQGTE